MKKLLIVLAVLIGPKWAFADLTWQTPIGTIGLPLTATEALVGYDAILKEAIAGASLPVYTDPKGLVALQVGAVAPWPNSGVGVQPYLGLGHDIAREIPGLAEYKSVHINAFGRYAPEFGKAGVGLSVSYGFGGGSLEPASPKPPVQ